MNQVSLKSLFKQNVFSSISVLRANAKGYLYVTLVGRHGSNNVYFGQKSSDLLAAKYQVGQSITKELGSATIIHAKNAEGEMRYKLSIQGVANDYSSTGEMEEIFNAEQEGTLDVVAFVKDFSVAPTPETAGSRSIPTPTLNTSTAPAAGEGEGEGEVDEEAAAEALLAAAKAKRAAAKTAAKKPI